MEEVRLRCDLLDDPDITARKIDLERIHRLYKPSAKDLGKALLQRPVPEEYFCFFIGNTEDIRIFLGTEVTPGGRKVRIPDLFDITADLCV